MIPKFRAWFIIGEEMIAAGDILAIDFENNELLAQEVYFERGLAVERDENRYRFDEINLMQSTGLKDKNYKEIFEGDIITNGTSIVDVKSHPTLGFYTVVNGEERFFGSNTSIKDFENDVEEFSSVTEIIGNIYENPELLEVTEWQ